MARDLSYAKTQRIVLLIDLNPLLYVPDPDRYLATVSSSAQRLISFPRLSSSLFSFKLFFSSLSPLLSSSKLSGFSLSCPSISFDFPGPTLASLSRAFDALKRSELLSSSTTSSRGIHVSASMRQIVFDYAWELVVRDPVIGTVVGFSDDGLDLVRSNLVVLFSPISRDLERVSEFLDVRIDNECLSDLNLFKSKFRGIFDGVNDLFRSRDIHLSWVDVKCEMGSDETSDSGLKLGFFESGIRELNWGFCSTDSIILGSSIISFGLIYPAICISPKAFSFSDGCRKFHVQTSLEILGVDGEPMECKCGELELAYSKLFHGKRHDEFVNSEGRDKELCKQSLSEQFLGGITKLNIKAVRMCDDLVELGRYTSEAFVVHEVSGESDRDQEQESEFYADRVLQMLARETGERVVRKSLPIWQILLSFLYRESYFVLASLSNSNGGSWTGILMPLTYSSALISVIDNGVSPRIVEQARCGAKVKSSEYKRKSGKRNLDLLHDITWAEFCRSVSSYTEIALEDVYFAKFSCSKKLKFLKCWMRQIKKLGYRSLAVSSHSKVSEDVEADAKEKNDLSEETEQSIPLPASEDEIILTGNSSSARQDNGAPTFVSESSESFCRNLPGKIKQGIESDEVDLAALAERLVNSCIVYFCQRHEKDNNCESGTPLLKSRDVAYTDMVTEELTKLLLKEPKDLVAKQKKKDSLAEASELKSAETAPNSNVREYELQIFFRMEILGSEVGAGIEESVKQKFVKHICLLLEAVQCHLDGGFFGDWSLDKYVGKTIKARYHHILGEVVDRIYTKMDLLLFTDEELPDSFLNSEDSNQSSREKQSSDLKTDSWRTKEEVLATNKQTLLQEKTKECRSTSRSDAEARKLLEAQERRERARRFAYFTSWMPDLQRVWAPKQAKTSKAKLDRVSKRKDRQRTRGNDTVCETPMTGNKRSCSRTDNSEEKDQHEGGPQSCGSVSKALFQDDP